jgi:Zn-dependent protease with chaperone function
VHEHQINGQVLHESLPGGTSACSLSFSGRTLVARLPSGDVMKMDIRHAEFERSGANADQFVYTSTLVGGPTFVTEDVDLYSAVGLAWPACHPSTQARSASLGKRRLSRAHKVAFGVVTSVLAVVVIAVLMLGPMVRVTLRFVPRSVDSRIGEQTYPHILRHVGEDGRAIEEDGVVEPVKTVLDRLAAAVPNNPFFFRVAVCRSPMVNAFALPGGQIIVTTGMLTTLESGEELAAVLAHEMNHVLFRHSMEMTVRASGLRFLAYVLSQDHPAAAIATSVWGAVGVMSLSRDKESQADREAVHLLANAGIDPKAMVPMLERLMSSEVQIPEDARDSTEAKLMERLRSHPETGKRIVDVEAEIASIPPVLAPQTIDMDYDALVEAVQALEARPSLNRAPGGMGTWDL